MYYLSGQCVFQSEIAFVVLYCALLLNLSDATQTDRDLGRRVFPALGADCVHFLGVLIGLMYFLSLS